MSTAERLLWAIPFGLFAVVKAIEWYRDEREIRQIRRQHEREMAEIRRLAP